MAKWLIFINDPERAANRKTRVWAVVNKDNGSELGIVEWYTGWRKYVFVPHASTLYEQDCLRDIADFCEQATRDQKERPSLVSRV